MAQRRAGLVQRNNRSTATTVKEVSSLDGDHKIIHTPDQNPDDESDSMDKQTRLTLMEEVLLLGLKDKEVRLFSLGLFYCISKIYFFYVLAWQFLAK